MQLPGCFELLSSSKHGCVLWIANCRVLLTYDNPFWQMGGGYIYGLALGFVLDCIGSTAGATAAFILGRSVSFVTNEAFLASCVMIVVCP